MKKSLLNWKSKWRIIKKKLMSSDTKGMQSKNSNKELKKKDKKLVNKKIINL